MLHITYRDNDGIITRRDISDPEIVLRYDRTYIRAYCHLRHDERTFRADNIISMVSGDDGTEINPFTLRPFTAPPDTEPPAHRTGAATVDRARTQQHAGMALTPSPRRTENATDTAPARRIDHDALAAGLSRIEDRTSNRIIAAVFFFIIVPVIAGGVWLRMLAMPEPLPVVVKDVTPPDTPVTKMVPGKAASVTPKPAPRPRYTDGQTFYYRGTEIMVTLTDEGWSFSSVHGAVDSLTDLKRMISHEDCRSRGFIFSDALMDIYFAADADTNGELSWNEIRAFQRRTVNRFTYWHNVLALPPERFLAEGGGDCEDFAIYTAGMLHYWGRTAYVGLMNRKSNRGMGHVICLLKVDSPPAGWNHFYLDASWWRDPSGEGYYIPIDYEYVGYFSSATGRNWVLQEVHWPRSLYNRPF